MTYQTSSERPADIGEGQRALSAMAGTMLLYFVSKKHKAESLLMLSGAYLLYRAISGHCPITAALKRNSRSNPAPNINIRTHIIVNKPRAEVYAFWRRLENWPLFMRHLENVDELDPTTSAWKLRLPGVGEVRCETRIVKEQKDSELSWRSADGAPIENTGKVNFSDTPGKGTRIDVMLSYRASHGPIGEKLARGLTPSFREKVEEDIRNFKQYIDLADKAPTTEVSQ